MRRALIALALLAPLLLPARAAAACVAPVPVYPGAQQIGATGVAAIAAQPSDDDYFTQVLGQPSNMSNTDDVDFWFTSVLGGLSNVTVNNNGNGLLEATANNNDPRVWVRVPTPTGAVPAPYEGSFKPIDVEIYG